MVRFRKKLIDRLVDRMAFMTCGQTACSHFESRLEMHHELYLAKLSIKLYLYFALVKAKVLALH